MLLTEWNWDDAKEVWQEEAREEGIASCPQLNSCFGQFPKAPPGGSGLFNPIPTSH